MDILNHSNMIFKEDAISIIHNLLNYNESKAEKRLEHPLLFDIK